MTAGEAQAPRRVMPRAFNSVFYRLATFFIIGSLCVGIVVPYSDPSLLAALSDARPGAGSSPYVIAMERLHIQVLPHIVNALVLTSIFSAGNSYVFCASRTLFGLALEGKMPKFLTRCTRSGVPIYCVAVTLAIALLSFLQVSNNSAVVLQWCVVLYVSEIFVLTDRFGQGRFVNLVTASQLLNYAIISFTYIRFHEVSSLCTSAKLLSVRLSTEPTYLGIESSTHPTRISTPSQFLAAFLRVSPICHGDITISTFYQIGTTRSPARSLWHSLAGTQCFCRGTGISPLSSFHTP